MAIFAKRKASKRSGSEMASGAFDDAANFASGEIDIDLNGGSASRAPSDVWAQGQGPSTGATGEGQTHAASDGPQVVEPVLVAGTVPTEVVASGVVKPAVVEPVDIEPVDLEPEAIEAVGETAAPPPFGIADAIRLMRSLPADPNIDLVVRVVRVTLGAVNVSIEDITQDAARKEKFIQDSIAALQAQVDDLEHQLYAKRCEIAAQEADLKETATVRERLHMADKYTGHRPPPTPLDAARTNQVRSPTEWSGDSSRSEPGPILSDKG